MSLTFECIRTVLTALPAHDAAVRLAIGKAKEFLAAEDDPNLRYLGLLALGMLGPAYASAVHECRDVVAQSLGDADSNIRREALHLMMGMIDDNNVMDIAGMLVSHAAKSDPEFAYDILGAVLSACGRNVYELVSDFDWYVSLLTDMGRNLHCAQGDEIGRQLIDVGLRVQDARPELVQSSRTLLIDPALLGNHLLCPVLSAAAWVSGEYVSFTKDPVELVEALLQPRTSLLPMSVRAVYIQAVLKVITFCCNSYVERLSDTSKEVAVALNGLSIDQAVGGGREASNGSGKEQITVPNMMEKDPFSHKSIVHMINLIETTVVPLAECNEVEVLERARNLIGFVYSLREIRELKESDVDDDKHNRVKELVKNMQTVFSDEIGPVSLNAQEKVTLSDDLVLNESLAELAEIVSEDDTTPSSSIVFYPRSRGSVETRDEPTLSLGSSSLLSEHRKRHGLYYLPTGKAEDDPVDYPHANDPQLPASNESALDDKLKTIQPVTSAKKPKAMKSRPKVVKLDGEDFLSTMVASTSVPREDSLSGAVGILLGRDLKPSSSQKDSDKSYEGIINKMDTGESSSQWKNNVNADLVGHPTSSSRPSIQQSHDKESTNPLESDGKEARKHRRSRSGHCQGKHKNRDRHSTQPDVPQAPIIQDFLL
uniref:Clathrin/coatomer adaptor adaptin-like N-terminal domain-containing protein n=2 Tax=Oryza brachyantha TaxID=4533 RepID=J3L0F5_ORYBR